MAAMDGVKSTAESLSWTVRLSEKAPQRLIVIFAAAVLAGLVGGVLLQSPLLGLLGFAIIVAATAEFWLGARFSLGPKGASAKVGPSLTQIEWADVKRVVFEREAVRLSPLEEAGRMEPFRGVVLQTTEENREQVKDMIRSHCREDVRFLGE